MILVMVRWRRKLINLRLLIALPPQSICSAVRGTAVDIHPVVVDIFLCNYPDDHQQQQPLDIALQWIIKNICRLLF